MDETPVREALPDWSAAADTTPVPASAFATQILGPAGPLQLPDGIVLNVGMVNQPVLLGTPEENAEAMSERYPAGLPVAVHGRFLLSRERAIEMVQLLQDAIATYDNIHEQAMALAAESGILVGGPQNHG